MLATTVTLLAIAPLASNVAKRVSKADFAALDPALLVPEYGPASAPTSLGALGGL